MVIYLKYVIFVLIEIHLFVAKYVAKYVLESNPILELHRERVVCFFTMASSCFRTLYKYRINGIYIVMWYTTVIVTA